MQPLADRTSHDSSNKQRSGTALLLSNREFKWFLLAQGAWFIAFGIQAVLFPYLVVNVLNESPERVGIAQMCLLAPALILMLPGGVMADASDLRSLLFRLQICVMVPVALLAFTAVSSGLTFAALVAFALAHGSLQAMVVPTRDALLSRVAGDNVQHAITTAMAIQFGCQVIGFMLAGTASSIGPANLLVVQTVLYGLGALCVLKLSPAPPILAPDSSTGEHDATEETWTQNVHHDNETDGAQTQNGHGANAAGRTQTHGVVPTHAQVAPPASPRARLRVRELVDVCRSIADSTQMAPVMLVMFGVGFFFIAVFNVVVPVMVRDIYLGDSSALAFVNGAFVGGMITGTIVLMRLPKIERQGLGIFVTSLVCTGLTALFGASPPVAIFYTVIFVFGISTAVTMSLGRTVVQQSANPHQRARVLAAYSLGFLGSAPLGSLAIGQLAERIGVLNAALVAAAGMGVLLVAVALRSSIWSVTNTAQSS